MERAVLEARIAEGESLTLEFKGEERNALNDRDLVEAVVCMANAAGGLLLVGVEDHERITGARPRHGAATQHCSSSTTERWPRPCASSRA
jgi:ATP-dependent DNA helicase RecG